jgi:hypothetical protein
VRIVAPTVSGTTGLLAALLRGNRGFFRIEEIVGTVAAGRLLGLATKE